MICARARRPAPAMASASGGLVLGDQDRPVDIGSAGRALK
ncbi:biotin--acetyl-CoA-carboxylase ligase domain protein [Mycobacterium kansasii]|uniref:Biotin--acetyl-CoA-carboxylase ligase domain protein n=1 Tax=Mycobacterium kansasii TaxID=1768 RepID=A0A1V3WKP3_MYCKA|nr:biotin--acetyl-CoA-carboxylase ligase domain protein [Mycobacterium kansasii]